jgi:excisionase family DNA binding protein
MRRVAARPKTTTVKQTKRQIRETYVRYKVVVTRVQVAERFVRATSEEDAASKVQAEFDRPYGYFGSWKTTSSEVDVIEAEQTTVIGPVHLSNEGSYLLSIKDASKALGISYSTLYQMTAQGDIEWVMIGSRKYISRESLMDLAERTAARGKLSPFLWWQLLADHHLRSRRLLVGSGSGDRASTSTYPLVSALSVVMGAPLGVQPQDIGMGCPRT